MWKRSSLDMTYVHVIAAIEGPVCRTNTGFRWKHCKQMTEVQLNNNNNSNSNANVHDNVNNNNANNANDNNNANNNNKCSVAMCCTRLNGY